MRGVVKGGNNSGLKINGIIEEYVIANGETISAGDFIQWVNGSKYNGNSKDNIKKSSYGNNITIGTSNPIWANGTTYMTASKINDNKILVAYADGLSPYYGYAVVITITGSSISVGTPVAFTSQNVTYIQSVTINDNKIILIYKNTNSYPTSIVLTVSETTITIGTPVIINTVGCTKVTVSYLNTDKVLVGYDASSVGYIVVLTIIDTTITVNTKVRIDASGNDYHITTIGLGIDRVFLYHCYYDGSNYHLRTRIVTVDITTITISTEYTDIATSSGGIDFDLSLTILNQNQIILGRYHLNGIDIKLLSISGSTITLLDSFNLETIDANTLSANSSFGIINASDNRVALSYTTSLGKKCLILTVSNNKIIRNPTYIYDPVNTTIYSGVFCYPNIIVALGNNSVNILQLNLNANGIAISGGIAGQTIKVNGIY